MLRHRAMMQAMRRDDASAFKRSPAPGCRQPNSGKGQDPSRRQILGSTFSQIFRNGDFAAGIQVVKSLSGG
jgi:hypothetical protein